MHNRPALAALPAMLLLALAHPAFATDDLPNSEQARVALERFATQDEATISRRWGAFAGAVGKTWVWESQQFSWDSWRWMVKGSAMLAVVVRCTGGTCDKAERRVQYNDEHQRLDFFNGDGEIERTGKVQPDGSVIIYAGSARFWPVALNTVRYDAAARTFAYSRSMVMHETTPEQLKRLAEASSPEALATVAFLPAEASAQADAPSFSPAGEDARKSASPARQEAPSSRDKGIREAPPRASAEAVQGGRHEARQSHSTPHAPSREPVASGQAKEQPKTATKPSPTQAASAGGKTVGKLYWFCSFFDYQGRDRTAYYSQTGELLAKRGTGPYGGGGYHRRTGELLGGFVEAKAKLQNAWGAYLRRTYSVEPGQGAYCSSDMRPDVIDGMRESSKAQKRNDLGFGRLVQTDWVPDGSE